MESTVSILSGTRRGLPGAVEGCGSYNGRSASFDYVANTAAPLRMLRLVGSITHLECTHNIHAPDVIELVGIREMVRVPGQQKTLSYLTINPKTISTANVAAARIPNLRRSAKT